MNPNRAIGRDPKLAGHFLLDACPVMQTAMRNLLRRRNLHPLNATSIEDRFTHVAQFDTLNLHFDRRAPLPAARHDALDLALNGASEGRQRLSENESENEKLVSHS